MTLISMHVNTIEVKKQSSGSMLNPNDDFVTALQNCHRESQMTQNSIFFTTYYAYHHETLSI